MIKSKNARETGDPQADAIRQAGFEQELCRSWPRTVRPIFDRLLQLEPAHKRAVRPCLHIGRL